MRILVATSAGQVRSTLYENFSHVRGSELTFIDWVLVTFLCLRCFIDNFSSFTTSTSADGGEAAMIELMDCSTDDSRMVEFELSIIATSESAGPEDTLRETIHLS